MSTLPDTCDAISAALEAAELRAELVAPAALDLVEPALADLLLDYGDAACPTVVQIEDTTAWPAVTETTWTGGCTTAAGFTFEGEVVDRAEEDRGIFVTVTRTLVATGLRVTGPDGVVEAEATLDWASVESWSESGANASRQRSAAGTLWLGATGDDLDFTAADESTSSTEATSFDGRSGTCTWSAEGASSSDGLAGGSSRIALPHNVVEAEHGLAICASEWVFHAATWLDGAWDAGPLWIEASPYTGDWTDADHDTWPIEYDCDDADPAAYPCAAEIPWDGVDQDCDGADITDVDGDGHDATEAGGDDCDDGAADVFPGAVELAYDGIDQDCNGADLDDLDADGWALGPDCDDADPARSPGAAEIPYDGIDQDCDGADLLDVDGDAWDLGPDCDDASPGIHPEATEIACDGVDQDCDGADLACPTADPDSARGCGSGAALLVAPLLLGLRRRRR